MGKTAIEWTERTWNPIVGCSLQSPGCKRCYAMKMAGRLEAMGVPYYQGTTQKTANGFVWTGKVATNDHALMEPLRRRTPTTWFVNSMSDLFHEDVSEQAIDRIFVVMALCPQHTFQVLTKRADRMRAYAERFSWERAVENCRDATGASMILKHSIANMWRAFGLAERFSYDPDCSAWPLPNAWLGVSVEDQKRADERVPDLLATPAAIRWLSCEPLLGPVDLTRIFMGEAQVDYAAGFDGPGTMRFNINALAGVQSFGWSGLDWIVVGGESGPGARPMHPDWARSLRDQCAEAGVPMLFKQWGDWFPYGEIDADGHQNSRTCGERPGKWHEWESGEGFSVRIGKKSAGRLLDGVLHDGVPAPAETTA